MEMSLDDRRRMQRGLEIYRSVREAVDRVPIAEIFHRLWYRFGYRYTILRNPQNHNLLEYYDYMSKLAERADQQEDGVAVFLDFLRQNLGRYERIDDLTVLKPRLPGVQLLTIHRSKGLEFPIVVLADMGNLGRPRRSASKPYYVSSQYGITVNLGSGNYFTEIGEMEAEKEELAEIKRLMYVALTRAKSHLVMAGTHKRRNRSSPRAHLNLLLRGLNLGETSPSAGLLNRKDYNLRIHEIEALSWEQLNREARLQADQAAAGHRSGGKELYEGQPIRRRAPRRDITVTELCAHLDPLLEQQRQERKLSTAPRRLKRVDADPLLKDRSLVTRFGVLTHQLLARWGSDTAGAPPQPDWTRMAGEHRDRFLDSAAALCRNFFASELGALCAKADRVDRELPFLYLFEDEQGPLYISGQIDLVFEYGEHLYLLDFKTDRSYKPGEHEGQLGLYRLALQEQTDKDIQSFLFLLRSGEAVPSDPSFDIEEWIPQVRHLL